jgi:lipopolysaccharide/colanic/teichoic acid biosynthesis glycosyltransferase
VLLSPLFLGVALAIKLTSKGPVFCRRKRIAQYGVPFVFWEFRYICIVDGLSKHQEYVRKLIADKAREGQIPSAATKAFFKMTSHPRVTRVGSFLRLTSLDALPMFFNVLKGEMSLVGPRPLSPDELEKYDLWQSRRLLEVEPGIDFWQYRRLLEVKPGIIHVSRFQIWRAELKRQKQLARER